MNVNASVIRYRGFATLMTAAAFSTRFDPSHTAVMSYTKFVQRILRASSDSLKMDSSDERKSISVEPSSDFASSMFAPRTSSRLIPGTACGRSCACFGRCCLFGSWIKSSAVVICRSLGVTDVIDAAHREQARHILERMWVTKTLYVMASPRSQRPGPTHLAAGSEIRGEGWRRRPRRSCVPGACGRFSGWSAAHRVVASGDI
jgi:hypothetical protein